MGEAVHYVVVNGASCTAAAVVAVLEFTNLPEDYDSDADFARAKREFERVSMGQITVFHYEGGRSVGGVAYSPYATAQTFHYAEECPHGL